MNADRRPSTPLRNRARPARNAGIAPRRRLACGVLLLLGAALAAGCPGPPPAQRVPGPPAPVVDRRPASLRLVVVASGAARPETKLPVAWAEIAATPGQRERGLMGRDRLEPDHGMLFVYPRPVPRRFWMKGCTMGLDIAFVRPDGAIAEIATLPPGDGLPDDRVAFADSGVPVLWVLEMEPGWFARHGIAAGDRIDVSSAVAGVTAE